MAHPNPLEPDLNFAPEHFRDYIGAVLQADIDSASVAVLTVMRFHCDENGVVSLSMPQIAAAAKVGRSTAFQRLSDLAAKSIVRQLSAGRDGSVYQLAHPSKSGEFRVTPVHETDGTRPADGRYPSAGRTVPVHETDGTRPADGRVNHIGVITCSDVNKTADEDARAPEPKAPIATTNVDTDEAAKKLQGHPGKDVLLPIARAAVSILGACPETYTLESWFQQRYSLPRIEYGLKQAKQAAMGQWVPMGKIIISAGRWMQNARPEEYQQGPQAPAQGPETARPVSAPQLETRKPLTPEETAEMLKELGV